MVSSIATIETGASLEGEILSPRIDVPAKRISSDIPFTKFSSGETAMSAETAPIKVMAVRALKRALPLNIYFSMGRIKRSINGTVSLTAKLSIPNSTDLLPNVAL